MADLKISQLNAGDPAQTNDEIPIARSGANYKITAGSISALPPTTAGANQVIYVNSAGTSLDGDANFVYTSTGNVGIGTTNPPYKLTTNYTAPATFTNAAGDFNQMWQASGTNALGVALSTGDTTARFVVNNSYAFAWNNAVSELMRLTSAGNLGIGTSSPVSRLEVVGTMAVPLANSKALLLLEGTDSQAAGNGAGVIFSGRYNETTFRATFAQVAGIKENSTSGNFAGALAFYSRVNGGSLNEVGRFDSSGNLGIGTTSPSYKLDVNRGSSGVVLNLNGVNAYDAETGITFSEGRAKISGFLNSSGGTPGSSLRFYTMPDGGSITERGRFMSNGEFLVGNTTNYGVGSAENNSVQAKGAIVLAANNTGSASNRNWAFQTNTAAAGSFSLAYSSTNTGWPNAAYALVVDSSGNVGIGTTSPGARLDVVSSTRPNFISNRSVSTGGSGSATYTAGQFKVTTTEQMSEGFGVQQEFVLRDADATDNLVASIVVLRDGADNSGAFTVRTAAAGSLTEKMRIDSSGNVVVNTAAVATTATDGFLYIPSCAGTPTGTPTAYTGRVPLVVDTTNNKLYFYSGGAWRDAGP